jgi:hypothetical protein
MAVEVNDAKEYTSFLAYSCWFCWRQFSIFSIIMTAAELIQARADHLLPNIGLTSWKVGEELS